MTPKKSTFGTAQEWLKRAKGNMALAKQPKPKEAFWDDLCFDAQQAAGRSSEGRQLGRKYNHVHAAEISMHISFEFG